VGHWHIQPSPVGYPEPSSAHTPQLGQQGTPHHLPQLRPGNSRGLSHSSVTQISSNSPPAHTTGQSAPPAPLLPSDGRFPSCVTHCHRHQEYFESCRAGSGTKWGCDTHTQAVVPGPSLPQHREQEKGPRPGRTPGESLASHT